MNKKVLSIILLCVSVAALIATLALALDTVLSLSNLNTSDVFANERLPGESIIGLTVGVAAILGGAALLEFFISLIGFFASLVNINIAENRAVKIVSYVFFGIYSMIVILLTLCTMFLLKNFI